MHSGISTLRITLTVLHASTTTLFQLHTKIKYIKFSQLILWHTLDLSRNIGCLNFNNEVQDDDHDDYDDTAYLFYKINAWHTLKINVYTVSLIRISEDTEANTASTLWVHSMYWQVICKAPLISAVHFSTGYCKKELLKYKLHFLEVTHISKLTQQNYYYQHGSYSLLYKFHIKNLKPLIKISHNCFYSPHIQIISYIRAGMHWKWRLEHY